VSCLTHAVTAIMLHADLCTTSCRCRGRDALTPRSSSRRRCSSSTASSPCASRPRCCATLHCVLAYWQHSHSHTCHPSRPGRFHYPKPPSATTRLLTQDDVARGQRASDLYMLQRSDGERFIAPYNPTILRLCQANMDLQFIHSSHGAAPYCSYLLLHRK
jgi:hypothetical protein